MTEFNFKDLSDDVKDAINAALEDLADEAVENVQKSLNKPYPPASMPGEAPHKRTGELQASVDHTDVKDFEVEVIAEAPYAQWLEFGTEKMEPRPFMAPEQQKIDAKIAEVMSKYIGDELK